jgi:hypothetical protein
MSETEKEKSEMWVILFWNKSKVNEGKWMKEHETNIEQENNSTQ